jgi:signal transduction histidine kinase
MTVSVGYAHITIRDKGLGIPAEEIPKVFERFYRGRSPRTSRQPGSGLGLAIAKWLIEKHQGEITLTSEVGSFTEVVVRIPCADANEVQDDDDAGASATASRKKPRVKTSAA